MFWKMTFGLFRFDIEDHTSSREEKNNDQSTKNIESATSKRKTQQSPITSYFKERKTVQENDSKRAKTAETGK